MNMAQDRNASTLLSFLFQLATDLKKAILH